MILKAGSYGISISHKLMFVNIYLSINIKNISLNIYCAPQVPGGGIKGG